MARLPFDFESNDEDLLDPILGQRSDPIYPVSSVNPRSSVTSAPPKVKQALAFEASVGAPFPENKPNAISEPALEALAKKDPDLVARYRAKMASSDQGVKDAEKTQEIANYGNIAGKLANDFANSQKDNTVYRNSWSKMGNAPQIDRAERKEYDGSAVTALGNQAVARAGKSRSQAENDFIQGEALVDKQQSRDDAGVARDRASKLSDPNSDISKRSQLLATSALQSSIKEAQQAGDKEGVERLKAIDVSKMTAVEAKDFYDGLKQTDYKTTLTNQAADKRLGRQLSAERDNTARKSETVARETTFKLSQSYNSDPTTKATAEVRSAAAKAEALAKNPTPTNDISLIFNYMKANDPGSTVREGEFALAARSGSLGDKMQAFVSQAATGQLTAEKRKEMLESIRSQAKSQEGRQAQVDQYYSEQAKAFGADDKLVIGSKRSTIDDSPKTVQMVDPNGTVYNIPESDVAEATKDGLKRK